MAPFRSKVKITAVLYGSQPDPPRIALPNAPLLSLQSDLKLGYIWRVENPKFISQDKTTLC
jgi:hypothetical protein